MLVYALVVKSTYSVADAPGAKLTLLFWGVQPVSPPVHSDDGEVSAYVALELPLLVTVKPSGLPRRHSWRSSDD